MVVANVANRRLAILRIVYPLGKKLAFVGLECTPVLALLRGRSYPFVPVLLSEHPQTHSKHL